MATRLRKSRRQRGTRYCGWGQIGQHRQSGSRGGIGGAGKHKHFWIRTVIEEPDHFGHPSTKSHSRNIVEKWANLRDLSSLLTSNNGVEKEGMVELNLSSLGISKLLGGGTVDKAMMIKVAAASEGARTKVESIGGKIILDEHSTH
ncbi:MAG: uL15 family ribosomal protein [Thermoproteota archaeon]|nr:uL15 family ribosomal protein [Thermoproteota archaeon]